LGIKALKLSWCGLDGTLEPMNPIFALGDISAPPVLIAN
jgi:hypothetical protein